MGGNQSEKDRNYINGDISIKDFLEKYNENDIPILKNSIQFFTRFTSY